MKWKAFRYYGKILEVEKSMKVFLFCFVGLVSSAFSQVTDSTKFNEEQQTYLAAQEFKLKELSETLYNNQLYEERRDANHLFIRMLAKALTTENSFYYVFPELSFVQISYAPDNSFRILTWQIEMNGKFYRHYGAIQMNAKELKLFPLIDRSEDMEEPEYAFGDNQKWYGALYYDIVKEKYDNYDVYVLLGFDMNHPLSNKKVVDILFFEEDKPFFGAPVFTSKKDPERRAFRYIMEYKGDASVGLSYDEERKEIIFDHLTPMRGEQDEGVYLYYVPDGTFDALVWTGREFVISENVIPTSYENLREEPEKESKSNTLYQPN